MREKVLADPKGCDVRAEALLQQLQKTAVACPPGSCPIQLQASVLSVAAGQTCGKCVPCREGLPQLYNMLQNVLDGIADQDSLDQIRDLAMTIKDSADCAIGYQAAATVLEGLELFADEYQAHVETGRCLPDRVQKVPCVEMCPAHVNIPGYIAYVGKQEYANSVKLIRRDNPLPTACAMICEHPCEEHCRRQLIDDALNIRYMKKVAVDEAPADTVENPAALPATGKNVAVIGGGPAGLTAAYFLALMGHTVDLYERHKELGGMLRYGIPNYRFPKDRLDEDIRAILSAGDIKVHYETMIDTAEAIKEVADAHDAMFVAIGAQEGKKLRLDGIDAEGVSSAVEMLDNIGNGIVPDYTGKNVVIIGGGNVAMDAARSAVRCGAKQVSCVYRRRQEDMTALDSEIEAAIAEGVEMITLQAPVSIEVDENGKCAGLVIRTQMASTYDAKGRPKPVDVDAPTEVVPCDIILNAVGQGIVSQPFEDFGMPAKWTIFQANPDTSVEGMPGVFVGGDCQTVPSTAIRAIAAGKVAAYAIDKYMGFEHQIDFGIEAPDAEPNNRIPTARVNIVERRAAVRKNDFDHVEIQMSFEEAMQEASRCLRCDHYGYGCVEGCDC